MSNIVLLADRQLLSLCTYPMTWWGHVIGRWDRVRGWGNDVGRWGDGTRGRRKGRLLGRLPVGGITLWVLLMGQRWLVECLRHKPLLHGNG